jgi:hypothetical protein
MLEREKNFVEYPLAESIEQAIAWMEAGNEVWQEDSNDWPNCGGFDEVEDLKYNFPDGFDKSYNIHLVPEVAEMAEPYKVGDAVVALEDLGYCGGQDPDEGICQGMVCYIDKIRLDCHGNQELYFHDHADRYGPWHSIYFVLNVCGDDI